MPRAMNLALPPFTKAVKWLMAINLGIFILELFAAKIISSDFDLLFNAIFGLVPDSVIHGLGPGYGWLGHVPALWQLLTYSFLHASFQHIFINMLVLWIFGGMIESDWGTRRFLELYFLSVLGGAVLTMVVAYAGVLGMSTNSLTVGASGGVYGLIVAYGIAYAEQEITLLIALILPLTMKAKYMAAIAIVTVMVSTISGGGGIASLAHMGGIICGWLYTKYAPRRGMAYVGSERYYGLRNAFFKWKRRKAQKKFQVYMGKQGKDVPEFDQYGNYIPPEERKEERKKDGGGQGGWVN
jgi:membrane associated rhomboid family serine protease